MKYINRTNVNYFDVMVSFVNEKGKTLIAAERKRKQVNKKKVFINTFTAMIFLH